MGNLSKNAFAIMARCGTTKMPFGITVDPRNDKQFAFVWAFKIKEGQGKREGYDKHFVKGSVVFDDGFNGCPYCKSQNLYICSNCGCVACYHGEENVTCPSCGVTSTIVEAGEIELKGSGY